VELTLPDGYVTSAHVWTPTEATGRLPVVYLHGIQSHPGWYVASSQALRDNGHAVYQITRRGSGDNMRQRGHARTAGQLLRDVDAACRFAIEQTGLPTCHLLGVSWGGKLAAAYMAAHKRTAEIASLTMVAPGIAGQVRPPFATQLAAGLCFGVWPTKRLAIPLDDVELFTDNEPMRAYLRADACQLHHGTARLFVISKRLDWMIRGTKPGCIDVPTTLLLAERDRIIHNAKTAHAVNRLTDDRAAVRMLDACHTMDFEPDPSEFLAALVEAVARAE
jgi:alpha-beta hydrolase superfamily lysophospholipase